MEKYIDGYLFSTDKEKLQHTYIHHFLSEESYWAKNIPIHIVEKAIEGSICFAIYDKQQQIGFARIITDHATFGYLADVFIDKAYRSKGLSKELMTFIMEQPIIKTLRRFMLATKDAHGLYTQFGFNELKEPNRFMEIKSFETY
jgi:N-acetylglutamate synthase-like GNAT family acetyltransferase